MGQPLADEYHVRMRASQRKYYAGHVSEIVKRKTLQKVREVGRIPRLATILQHRIEAEALQEAMRGFIEDHPETKAARRIQEYLCVWVECA